MGKLIGGSALRARLVNMAAVPPQFASEWAEETRRRILATKPASTRPESSRFTTKATRTRGGVYGAFWWVFVDRGTKAHDIVPRKKQALRFESHGETIFTRRVHLRRKTRRPFISKAAQGSRDDLGKDFIIKAWNGRKIRGPHTRFL